MIQHFSPSPSKTHFGLLMLSVLGISMLPVSATAQTPSPLDSVANALGIENPDQMKLDMAAALDSGRIGEVEFQDATAMQNFYMAHDFQPVWQESGFFSDSDADRIEKVLSNAWRHGVNPERYHLADIQNLKTRNQVSEKVTLDLLLTDAIVLYARDLTGMRINARDIGQNAKYWREAMNATDILNHVMATTDITKAMRDFAPQGRLYKKLQAELLKLYQTPERGTDLPMISPSRTLRIGNSDKAVAQIRERMGFDVTTDNPESYVYDDALAQAVMAFQKSHGLTPDGVIGPRTIETMNMTRQDQINQILVNLERMRWIDTTQSERYVMVNVPAATLWAVDNGRVKLEMPVVVGRTKRPTNIFTTTITGIRYNPTWTVPPTIKREDYLPKLQEDPYYLYDRGIELMDGKMSVDPGLINWAEKSWQEVNAMRMVQGASASNPLGRVRVIMNNPFNIYLHDTPNKSYFVRSDRALSSGCVRMHKPQELADFVLETNEGWTGAKRDAVLATGKQTEIWAQQPIPVYILYQTVWMGDNSQVVFGPDIYGHDVKLLNVLKGMNGIPALKDVGEVVAGADEDNADENSLVPAVDFFFNN